LQRKGPKKIESGGGVTGDSRAEAECCRRRNSHGMRDRRNVCRHIKEKKEKSSKGGPQSKKGAGGGTRLRRSCGRRAGRQLRDKESRADVRGNSKPKKGEAKLSRENRYGSHTGNIKELGGGTKHR